MAQNQNSSQFCLPPQFFTTSSKNDAVSTSLFPYFITSPKNDAVSTTLFPYFITSPTVTEQQQQHITELTRQMTLSSLHNQLALSNHKDLFVNEFENGRFGKGSTGNDDVLKLNAQKARYDLLHAAAGEDERIRQVNNFEEAFYGFVPKKPSGFHTQNHQRSFSQKQLQLQIAQFDMLKKHWLKQREEFVTSFSQRESGNYQNVPGSNETVFQGKVGLSSSAAWPSSKNRSSNNRNKNKAIFHGNPNLKNERNGTGVFLPRVADNTESSRKKSGCKNVVVPERVAPALNKKVEDGMMRDYIQQKNRFYGVSISNNENNGVGRIVGVENGFSQQKRNVKAHQTEGNLEIRLPQEWTY
ncbi:hypothetical protein TSUD_264360 [Trifolium subterraneum]|uniref:Uncharacterized protein n=1 Tax=Trifolium subterraneum TaxID=3900 RepID=A0A2Z6N0Y9_TRISU|nr:hypothetical protein TSUD_264360 [Trifolium subterraneum]